MSPSKASLPAPDGFRTVTNKRHSSPLSPALNGTPKRRNTDTSPTNPNPLAGSSARLPSIILDATADSRSLLNEFKRKYQPVYFEYKLRANKMHIFTETPETHRKLVSFADKNNAKFTIVQLQEERPLKVVMRNIPSFVEEIELQDELVDKGYVVEKVTQMTSHKTKSKLPRYIISLKKEGIYEDIFKIKTLLHARVRVEKYQQRSILQCFNCQEFSHGARACRRPPACLHCAGPHDTRHCVNKETCTPKCANCSGPHKAFDRSCPIRQREEEKYRINIKKLQAILPNNAHIPNPLLAPEPPIPATRSTFITPRATRPNALNNREFPPLSSKRKLNFNNKKTTPQNTTPKQQTAPQKRTPKQQSPKPIPNTPERSGLAAAALREAITRIKAIQPLLLETDIIVQLLALNLKATNVNPDGNRDKDVTILKEWVIDLVNMK
jgi:Associated with zinc fingers